MKEYEAKKIIKEVFENTFDKEKYTYFVKNLLKNIEIKPFGNGGAYTGNLIPKAYQNIIRKMERIGKFEDKEGNITDVLIVELKREHSVEFARSSQRNFIRWYLNGSRGGEFKDAGLVAFYSQKSPDWRFSLIKMQYSLQKGQDELTPAKRSSFLVGEKGKSHTAQKQLVGILKDDNPPYLSDLEEAFNIESVSEEFFERYKAQLFNLKDELDKIVANDEIIKKEFEIKKIDTLHFAKKLLGQIVFLYFLQRKGWLGLKQGQSYGEGDRNFLRNLFNQAKSSNENFFNDYLEFLFYDALSKKRDTDFYKKFNCRIPFLNGGLFDPINFYDWEKTDIVIPNNIFSNKTDDNDEGSGILDIFDLFNFTVKEDEPLEKEVAIDPEMLGKVFERMLEVKERKNSGAFYTPRAIVHYMAQQSLLYYLLNEFEKIILKNKGKQPLFEIKQKKGLLKLPFEEKALMSIKKDLEIFIHYGEHIIEIEKALSSGELKEGGKYKHGIPESIRKNAKFIDNALEKIKICDPAVGSGAFPVGVMNEIVRLRNILTEFIDDKKDRSDYCFKANAIEKSIYGVDIDESAVEIAKLRLWLSLVVDEENIDNIKPLPNLDYKIVKGNSLINIPQNSLYASKLKIYKETIHKLTKEYYNITNKSEKRKMKNVIDSKIQEILEFISNNEKYRIDFDFKLFFHEVFNKNGGFDIVIANPPYIKEYTNKSAFNGTRGSECYQGKMDIWYLFGCKGIDIIKPNSGLLSFIATNNWVTNSGASKFRNKVLRETKISEFIDFGDYKVFESAGIQTMVMFLQKTINNHKYYCEYAKVLDKNISRDELETFLKKIPNKKFVYYNALIDKNELQDKPIHFLKKEIAEVLEKIRSKSNFKLSDNEIAQGIVAPQDFLNKKNQAILGSNYSIGEGIFNLTTKEIDNLNLQEYEKKDLIRPFYTTEQLHKYYGNPQNKLWIIYTDSRFKNPDAMKKYPNIKKHLDRFQKIITSDNKPYGLHRARDEKFFKGEKIISLRKCKEPTFTYTDFNCYVSQTYFVIKTVELILSILLHY